MFSVFPLKPKLRSCTAETDQREYFEKTLQGSQPNFCLAFPHLQSGGMTAEVGRVDEAEAEDSDAATVEGSDVTQSTVLQIC